MHEGTALHNHPLKKNISLLVPDNKILLTASKQYILLVIFCYINSTTKFDIT